MLKTITGLAGAGALGLATLALTAGEAPAGEAVLYKNPQCGCCEAYADYLREDNFTVGVQPTDELAAGRVDRESLRDGLLEMRAYPGATGVLTMRPDGNARRRPFLLGVRGRRFEPLD